MNGRRRKSSCQALVHSASDPACDLGSSRPGAALRPKRRSMPTYTELRSRGSQPLLQEHTLKALPGGSQSVLDEKAGINLPEVGQGECEDNETSGKGSLKGRMTQLR